MLFVIVSMIALQNADQIKTPPLLKEDSYDVARIVEAANHYIVKGEASLIHDIKSCKYRRRAAWLCLMLYEPKGKDPLGYPSWGDLGIPYKTMPLDEWPIIPLVKAGSSYFVMAEPNTYLGANPESVEHYIDSCKKAGRFRKKLLAVPSPEVAEKDLAELLRSPKWKAIKWSDLTGGTGYILSERRMVDGLKAQIPKSKIDK
jgi:hypothetical protein